jgi:outer membrane protein assembly factor BamB
MSGWRKLVSRPELGYAAQRALRALVPAAVLALLLLVMSGCGRGVRHESWPGLTVADGTVYAANLESVQAVNAETGKVYWSFPWGEGQNLGPFYSAPILSEDHGDNGVLLLAGFSDRTVYALALGATPAERPDELWRFAEAGGQYVGTGTVEEDLFIIGNGDGSVYALNIGDGSQAWEFATDDRVWASPVVVDDRVYVASLDHHLYALDLATGEVRWQLETAGSVSATPVYANGYLWIGDFASTLYQVDLATGEAVWTYEANDWLWSTPVADGNTLYFGDVGGAVYALNTDTRSLLWDSPAAVEDVIHGALTLSPDGSRIFVPGHEQGLISVINTETGKVLQTWGDDLQNRGRLPGDLVTDGEQLYAMPILVPTRVQAFDIATGDVVWSIPELEE